MSIYLNCLKQLNMVFIRVIPSQKSFLMSRKPSIEFGSMYFFKLTSMDLNKKLIRWVINFLCKSKLTISVNNHLIDPYSFHFLRSDILKTTEAQTSLSHFADDIEIWAQAPGIRNIKFRLQKYLKQMLIWCDRWRIKLNLRKSYLINFFQRNFY